jgi:hypothetical protein
MARQNAISQTRPAGLLALTIAAVGIKLTPQRLQNCNPGTDSYPQDGQYIYTFPFRQYDLILWQVSPIKPAALSACQYLPCNQYITTDK